MADDTDVLLALCQEHWTQARHTEQQRATISNLVAVLAAVIVGFVSHLGFTPTAIPLTGLLIGLGLFGAFSTWKLYELFHFHHDKVKRWQRRIDELHPDAQVAKLEREADARHEERYGWRRGLRLYWLWMMLHLAIATMGIILTILSLV